jgi:hypothetical protein
MKRRGFLKAVLGGCAAVFVPLKKKAVPFSEVFQPAGSWVDITPEDFAFEGQEMDLVCHDETATLDGIFKRCYAGKIKSCYPTPFGFTPSFDSEGPVFSQPIVLKHENGFTS